MPDDIEQTFKYTAEHLAKLFAQANACPADVLNTEAVEQQLITYGRGVVAGVYPSLENVPFEVVWGDPNKAKEEAQKRFEDAVEHYDDVERAFFPYPNGNPMRFQFADELLEVEDCKGGIQ